MKRLFKIAVASLAFAPMIVMFTETCLYPDHPAPESTAGTIFDGCSAYYLPVFSLVNAIDTFQPGKVIWFATLILGLIGWSYLIACILWKIVAAILGEEEPGGLSNKGRFDWVRFQVRFACGFILGCLTGWRFVRETNSMSTLLIPTLATGLGVGLIFGLSRPPDFWSRRF